MVMATRMVWLTLIILFILIVGGILLVAAVLVSSISTLRLKPKQILSQME